MAQFIKKPIVMEAEQLLKTEESILKCLRFMGDTSDTSSNIGSDKFNEYYRSLIAEGKGLRLKTPESDNETQIVSFGDYIFKGYSKDLGWHFWPVKADYVAENYEPVL